MHLYFLVKYPNSGELYLLKRTEKCVLSGYNWQKQQVNSSVCKNKAEAEDLENNLI